MNQSKKTYHVAWLPGDGIGRDVTEGALRVLEAAGDVLGFEFEADEHLIGGAALDETGQPFPDETRKACQEADAVLLGAVGGPAWDDETGSRRPESGLLALRKSLNAYANLRPVAVPEALADASPLRRERVTGTDILIVRELTGGIYFGEGRALEDGSEAYNAMHYTKEEVLRIARIAFEQARARSGRITSVDKANVLDVSQFWRSAVMELHDENYRDLPLNHLYVDNAAMQLVLNPTQFDVVLTGNLFGDILSDLAATLPGSLGLLPSASIGGKVGLFEPVHGSAPDLAGQDTANPIAAILSGAMLLSELGESEAAAAIRRSVDDVLNDGYRTADLWSEGQRKTSTSEMSDRIAKRTVAALEEVPA